MQQLTKVGLGLLGGWIALTLLAFTGGSVGAVFGSLAGTLFLAGIICLIVSAVRGRGQQQQQQVVIYTGHAPGGPQQPAVQVRCPDCSTLNAAADRFCANCGGAIGQVGVRTMPAPTAAPVRSPGPTGTKSAASKPAGTRTRSADARVARPARPKA